MIRLLPWFLCLVLATGWYFAVNPGRLPFGGLLRGSGVAATARERMLREWAAVGFDTSAVGRSWLAVGDSALIAAQPTQLPLALRAYFGQEPAATAWSFRANAGQFLPIEVEANLLDGAPIIELYRRRMVGDSTQLELLRELKLGRDTLELAPDANHELILRVEATPLAQGNVRVRIGTAPLLGVFPVEDAGIRHIQSFWGVDRDGGRRRHEGIDIFRPRGTPLLAAADGIVTGVKEGGLGGRQVWLRPRGMGVSLYYAHLDSWAVSEGDRVRAGDTLGTVGNTGNALTTPAHLHFGIYTRSGAIDPLPFVAPAIESTRPLGAALGRTGTTFVTRQIGSGALRLSAKQFVRPLATANAQTWIRLPDGSTRLVAVDALATAKADRAPEQRLVGSQLLRAGAKVSSPVIDSLPAGTQVHILALAEGSKNAARYIESDAGRRGWLVEE